MIHPTDDGDPLSPDPRGAVGGGVPIAPESDGLIALFRDYDIKNANAWVEDGRLGQAENPSAAYVNRVRLMFKTADDARDVFLNALRSRAAPAQPPGEG